MSQQASCNNELFLVTWLQKNMHCELGNVSMKTHSHKHTHTEKGTRLQSFECTKRKKNASHTTDLQTNTNLEGHTPSSQLTAIRTLSSFQGNNHVFVGAHKHFWTTEATQRCFLTRPDFSATRMICGNLALLWLRRNSRRQQEFNGVKPTCITCSAFSALLCYSEQTAFKHQLGAV